MSRLSFGQIKEIARSRRRHNEFACIERVSRNKLWAIRRRKPVYGLGGRMPRMIAGNRNHY